MDSPLNAVLSELSQRAADSVAVAHLAVEMLTHRLLRDAKPLGDLTLIQLTTP